MTFDLNFYLKRENYSACYHLLAPSSLSAMASATKPAWLHIVVYLVFDVGAFPGAMI